MNIGKKTDNVEQCSESRQDFRIPSKERRDGFRSYARQSVVEFAEIEPAAIHRLAIRRGGLTSNVPQKTNRKSVTALPSRAENLGESRYAVASSSSFPARSSRSRRNGLSLLEVILAIAILGSSMAVIGNLFFLGYRSALQTQLRSDANILADAKMAELAAGVIPVESVGNQTIEENPLWSYSVDVGSSDQLGLLIATVTVQQDDTAVAVPISLSIVRFVPDPDYDPAEDLE